MSLATLRTLLVALLLFTVSTAAYAAKTKGQVALSWAFALTWFGMVGLVSGVIWFMIRLDRRTAGIERALYDLNKTLTMGLGRSSESESPPR